MSKILYVNDFYEGGGTEIFTKQLYNNFSERGFTTFMATGDDSHKINALGGLWFLLLRRTIFQNSDPLAARSFERIVKDIRPDIVHALNLYRLSLAPVIIARKHSIPCVMTICDYWPVCLNRGLMYPATAEGVICLYREWEKCTGDCKHRKAGRFIAPFTKRGMKRRVEILNDLMNEVNVKMIATSKAVADILGTFGLNRAMIDIIIPGVDIGLFAKGDEKREKIALFVGRPDPLKGTHIFCRIAEMVKKRIPDSRFIAIGGHLPSDHVESLGKVEINTLLAYYRSASCVCVPSIWPEPLGAIALEAMSCGTPVVAHGLGGLVETVVDGETGFLVQAGDIDGFVDKVSFLLSNPEQRSRMGIRARRRVEEKFNINDTFKSYFTIYEKIIR